MHTLGIKLNGDARCELTSNRRYTFELELPSKRCIPLLQSRQIIRSKISRHQQLLWSKLLLLRRDRTENVDDQATRLWHVQLSQCRHAERLSIDEYLVDYKPSSLVDSANFARRNQRFHPKLNAHRLALESRSIASDR